MRGPVRALFVSEGTLGHEVLGPASAAAAITAHIAETDLAARFVPLPPMGRAALAVSRGVPGLGHADLDLQPLRWHLAQSVRTRVAVERALRRAPADVLHIQSHSIGLLCGGVERRIPTALSVDATVRDWHAFGIWRVARPWSAATLEPSAALERRAFARAAVVLAWTPWAAAGVRRACPTAHVVEHHPGLDVARFRPAERRPRERPRVLFVGGRFGAKGGDLLLAALGPLAGRELDLDLVTKADVPARPGVRVHALAPGDPALIDLYQQADVFCLPTRGDAVPFSVIEAMATGAAVVASDIGAIPDLLADGRCGRLIPSGNRRALFEAVTGLLADAPQRAALARAGRERCETHFDARTQTRRLATLLRAAAGAP
jgi:glycosyltransferase involved in cell wall biosynthesis